MLRVRENSTLGKAKHTGVCHFGCVSICEQGDSPLSKIIGVGVGIKKAVAGAEWGADYCDV